MKEIKAVIQPFMLDAVIEALKGHPELPGATVSEVVGFGKERAADTPSQYRQEIGRYGFARKVKLEIVVADELAGPVCDLIHRHAHTGNPGDGVIFLSPVERITRIRSQPDASP